MNGDAFASPDVDDLPVFDRPALVGRCVGREDLMLRVLGTFDNRFAEDLEQLETATRGGELLKAAGLAHRMKGSAANVGGCRLAAVLSFIESELRSGRSAAAIEQLRCVREELTLFEQARNKTQSESDAPERVAEPAKSTTLTAKG